MIFGRFKEIFLSSFLYKKVIETESRKKHLYNIEKIREVVLKSRPTWTFESIASSLFFGVATTRLASITSQNLNGALSGLHATLTTFRAFGPLSVVGPLTIYGSTLTKKNQIKYFGALKKSGKFILTETKGKASWS